MRNHRTEDVRLTEQQKLLLYVFKGFAESLDRPTTALFHEYLLLLKENSHFASKLDFYKFRSYIKGAFSDKLRDELEVLFKKGLISYKNNKITITKDGELVLRKIIDEPGIEETKSYYDNIRNRYKSAHSIYTGTNGYHNDTKIGEELHSPH